MRSFIAAEYTRSMAKEVHYTDPSQQSERPEYDNEAAVDYVNNLEHIQNERHRKKRSRVLMVTLLAVLTIGALGYLYAKQFDISAQQPESQSVQTVKPDTSEQVAKSERFTSKDMSLSFDYPGNWSVDDSAKGLIRVESPVVKLADINGESSDSKVVLMIMSKNSEVPGFGDTGATAVRDSEKLTYTSPSQNQRAKTFLSFAGFGRSGLDAVFVTGDSGYQQGQSIPEDDIKNSDPIISVSFYSCDDAKCADEGSGAYTIKVDEWESSDTLQAVQNILKSVRVE